MPPTRFARRRRFAPAGGGTIKKKNGSQVGKGLSLDVFHLVEEDDGQVDDVDKPFGGEVSETNEKG